MMEKMTPLSDNISNRNVSDKTIKKENKSTIKNNTPKINNEFFKIIKA